MILPEGAMKAWRIRFPSRGRMGMFWRFGLLLESPRRRHRLVVGGVDPPSPGVHQLREGIDVRRFQFDHFPVGEDFRGELMGQGEGGEDIHICLLYTSDAADE